MRLIAAVLGWIVLLGCGRVDESPANDETGETGTPTDARADATSTETRPDGCPTFLPGGSTCDITQVDKTCEYTRTCTSSGEGLVEIFKCVASEGAYYWIASGWRFCPKDGG